MRRTTINSCVCILSSLLFNLYTIVYILIIIYLHIIVSCIHLFKFTKRDHHPIHSPSRVITIGWISLKFLTISNSNQACGPHPKIHFSMYSSLFPTLLCYPPVRNKPIFMLQKYRTHTTILFSNAYIYHTHITNPFFYAYSMSESHTWDMVCERQRDPSYISRERMVVTGMQRWV